MTTPAAYSTSTSDRCEAKNRLTCPHHGVAGDFTEVPAHVQANVQRHDALRSSWLEHKEELDEYAARFGIKTRNQLATVVYGGPTPNMSEDDFDSLVSLHAERQEAAMLLEEEDDHRADEALDFVRQQAKAEFGEDKGLNKRAASLVGLRFMREEEELEHEENPQLAPEATDIYQETRRRRGYGRQELFSTLVEVPEAREKLRRLDRAYFTALSGRIPSDADLDKVAQYREARRLFPIVREHIKDESFAFITKLSEPTKVS